MRAFAVQRCSLRSAATSEADSVGDVSAHQHVSMRVVANRGETLMEIVRLTFEGRVVHAQRLAAMLLPETNGGSGERVALIANLPDGQVLFVETTLSLLRMVLEELSPPGPH